MPKLESLGPSPAQEQQRFATLLANADSLNTQNLALAKLFSLWPSCVTARVKYVWYVWIVFGVGVRAEKAKAWDSLKDNLLPQNASEFCRPWRPDCTGCQGEEEATAIKERMSEETKVMMAVRTPSFQSWIQRPDPEVWLLHVAIVDPVTTMWRPCSFIVLYFQHLAAEDAAKAELQLYTRSVLGSQEFDWGDHQVAFVALKDVESLIREKKMSVIRSRINFKIKSLPVAAESDVSIIPSKPRGDTNGPVDLEKACQQQQLRMCTTFRATCYLFWSSGTWGASSQVMKPLCLWLAVFICGCFFDFFDSCSCLFMFFHLICWSGSDWAAFNRCTLLEWRVLYGPTAHAKTCKIWRKHGEPWGTFEPHHRTAATWCSWKGSLLWSPDEWRMWDSDGQRWLVCPIALRWSFPHLPEGL